MDRVALGVETSIAELARSGSVMRELGAPLDAPWPDPEADAADPFTSGSTGPAKGAVLTHRQLGAMFTAVGDTLQLAPERGLVAGFATFALLGPALGAPTVVPDMDITRPGELTAPALAAAIAALGRPAVFTAPAALRNILDTADQLDDAGRAAMADAASFFSAGAPIPAHLLRDLRSLMPNARALTPYGMTECLAVAAIDLEGIEEAGEGSGVCVGRPVPRVEIAIAEMDELGRTTGTIIDTPGVSGEILVRGPHVRDRYLMLWRTTHTAMRFEGWHATGDVGHLDEEGRLWVEGRADRRPGCRATPGLRGPGAPRRGSARRPRDAPALPCRRGRRRPGPHRRRHRPGRRARRRRSTGARVQLPRCRRGHLPRCPARCRRPPA